MKNIFKRTFVVMIFTFFLITISYAESNIVLNASIEKDILLDNRYDTIYDNANKILSLWDKDKSDNLILDYFNKAWFYNCNIFKYYKKVDPDNTLYWDYLDSCVLLTEEWDMQEAYSIIEDNLKNKDNNDIFILYNIYLLWMNKKVDDLELTSLFDSIKNKEKLFLIKEYIDFRIKLNNGYLNDNEILFSEDYISKKFFLFLYYKNIFDNALIESDELTESGALNTLTESDELNESFLWLLNFENTSYWDAYKKWQSKVTSYYQWVFSYLFKINKKDSYLNLLYFSKYYNEYLGLNKLWIENQEEHIYKLKTENRTFLMLALDKNIIEMIKLGKLKIEDIYDIINISDEKNDIKILKLFYNLYLNKKGEDFANEKEQKEFLDLLFCNNWNSFFKSEDLMDIFVFKEIINIEYKYDKDICDIKLLDKHWFKESWYNKKYILYWFFIVLLIMIGLFYRRKKSN